MYIYTYTNEQIVTNFDLFQIFRVTFLIGETFYIASNI